MNIGTISEILEADIMINNIRYFERVIEENASPLYSIFKIPENEIAFSISKLRRNIVLLEKKWNSIQREGIDKDLEIEIYNGIVYAKSKINDLIKKIMKNEISYNDTSKMYENISQLYEVLDEYVYESI